MKISRAFEEDIESLCRIEKEHEGYAFWGKAGFEAEFSKPFSVTLKAQEGNLTAGFINFWILRPKTEINTLVVSKSFLRRGIGKALLNKALEYAKKNECNQALLEVSCVNAAAVSLYLSMGFEKISVRPKYYNNTYDALVMAKRIEI
ncbi:MAG: ribosomal protein S18-alanine N-acetyltransferase [Elusimicrobia bacterium]|nr:ribosomal protein S18-alanine N-acetyltransferase [Elusimicrobiota bacterium]